MPESRTCPTCGAILPPFGRQCPECLLGLGLGGTLASELDSFGHDFGAYKLIKEIARGGMGVVFKAHQPALDRIVALKMILAGHFASTDTVRRFHAEAEAAARLRHPHIVAIHDVGEHNGQHYFTMDYIEGVNLAQAVREKPLLPRQAAEMLSTVAQAIQYAHEHGVLHRDLKPSNILLDTEGQPHVTDFGLAKRFAGSDPKHLIGSSTGDSLTLTGQMLGSPNYISPEQASGKRGTIGPATDVYALGAVLCHILTGRAPFVGDSVADILEQVLDREPLSPRLLNPAVPRDLETICLKCLEKDPSRRYSTARELGEDLNRFLRDVPICARPLGTLGRAWRWCRRQPVVAGLITACVLAVALGFAGVLWQKAGVQHTLVRQYVANGTRLMDEGDLFGSLLWYTEALKLDAGSAKREEPHRIRIASVLDQCPKLLQLFSHGTAIFGAEFNPDGRTLITASDDHTARIWDLDSGRVLQLLTHQDEVYHASFSSDGKRVLTASRDGTAQVWSASTGAPSFPPLQHLKPVWHATFDPNGLRIATVCDDNSVRIWNGITGEPLTPPLFQDQAPIRVVFSPNGRLLQVDTYFTLSLLDALTGAPVLTNITHDGGAAPASFGPNSNQLLTHSANSSVILDLGSGGKQKGSFTDQEWIDLATFSSDGSRILTCDRHHGAHVWDAKDLRPLFPTTVGSSDATGAFSPDGTCIITSGRDRTVRIWDAETGDPLTPRILHPSFITRVQFHPDGHRFLTLCGQRSVRVWDLAKDSLIYGLQKPKPALSNRYMDGNRNRTFATGASNTLWCIDMVTGRKLSKPMVHSEEILSAWFDPSNQMILTACGSFIKPAKWEASIALWDTNGNRLNSIPMKQETEFLCEAFSADGTRLVTGGYRAARLWEVPSGRSLAELNHGTPVIFVGFSKEGKAIVTIDNEHNVRLWNASSGLALGRPIHASKPLSQAVLSTEMDRLCVVAVDSMVQYWSLSSEEPLTPFLPTSEEPDAKPWDVLRCPATTFPVQDLVRLAQLHSARVADASAIERELPQELLPGLMATLKKSHPNLFVGQAQSIIEWHKDQIRAAESKGRHETARSHLQRLQRLPNLSSRDSQFHDSEMLWLEAANSSPEKHRWVVRRAGPRDNHCPPQCIDLSEFFSYPLCDGDHLGDTLEGIIPGLMELGGIPFDVRGAVRLSSRTGVNRTVPLPQKLEGIPIHQKCRRLHFLQHASVESAVGTRIGFYVLRYLGGDSEELPIVYGQHLTNDWIWHDFELNLTDAKIVWTGTSPNCRQDGYSLAMALATYDNPKPDLEIERVDFVSTMTMSSPILVALTLE